MDMKLAMKRAGRHLEVAVFHKLRLLINREMQSKLCTFSKNALHGEDSSMASYYFLSHSGSSLASVLLYLS